LVVLAITLWVGIWSDQSQGTKEWARALVTLQIGGIVGYLTGRTSR
jgi:hypothetical protein